MKSTIKILSFLLLLVLFVSCKKDEVVVPSVSDTYWEATSATTSIIDAGVKTDQILDTKEKLVKEKLYIWYYLSPDGNMYKNYVVKPTSKDAKEGTWSQTGDIITFTIIGGGGLTLVSPTDGSKFTFSHSNIDVDLSMFVNVNFTKR